MQEIKRIKLDVNDEKIYIYPVLADEFVDDLPLTAVYVDTILNPQNISKIILELNSILPIPGLMHLKRVSQKDVLLFPCNGITENELYALLREKKFDTSQLENNPRKVMVAEIPPKVRRQYEVVHKTWPCNFHSNKYLEKLSTNTLFSEKELRAHAAFMSVAIDAAKYAKQFREDQVGAVIVDPKINSIVAAGFHRTNEGPCRHAVMVAVDNVAKTQNGGRWNLNEAHTFKEDLNLNGFSTDLLGFLTDKHRALRFGAAWFKGKSDLEEPADGPYLCTGYYVYVTHEPCIMCAMGLIHSRAKRVFFGVKTARGGLQTLCKIHTVKDLNHHYEVFGGLLEQWCSEL